MTKERIKRTVIAINETIDLLNNELSYSGDLQCKSKIEFYKNHINRLQNEVNKND